jgi:DNA invertase Pin-like site-specific DNA recombinase
MQKSQTIAYLRVSTTDQDLEKNKFDILQLANEKVLGQVQWVEETVSRRVSWRKRQIAQILQDQLQSGDNLIVSELSRLGRSMLECMCTSSNFLGHIKSLREFVLFPLDWTSKYLLKGRS